MDEEAFIQASEVSILVPEDTEIDIKDALLNNGQRAPHSIPQRKLLFFDETLPIYVVLQTPTQEIRDLERFTKRLIVSLELRAVGTTSDDSERPKGTEEITQARQEDIIWKGTLVATEEPIVIEAHGHGDSNGHSKMLAVWETKASLSRPRLTMRAPMIMFYSNASIQVGEGDSNSGGLDPYLPSGLPAPENLLAPLGNAKGQMKCAPSLSSLRLHRVKPFIESTGDSLLSLNVNVPAAFPAFPAIRSRIRHCPSSNNISRLYVFVALDLEITPFSHQNVEIRKVEFQASDCIISELSQGLAPKLPLQCSSRDNVVLLYRLNPHIPGSKTSERAPTRIVDITIDVRVIISKTCAPVIRTSWSSTVDISLAFNSYQNSSTKSIQRASRPPAIAINPSSYALSSNNMLRSREGRPISTGQMGITITFSAPRVVYVGEESAWDILVLNNSTKPRQLILSTVSKTTACWQQNPKPQSSLSLTPRMNIEAFAEATVDDKTPFASQKHRLGHEVAPDVLALTKKLETGTLQPGDCKSLQLRFVALSLGCVHSDSFRVTDEQSGNYVDVSDLPSLFVEQK